MRIALIYFATYSLDLVALSLPIYLWKEKEKVQFFAVKVKLTVEIIILPKPIVNDNSTPKDQYSKFIGGLPKWIKFKDGIAD